MNESERRYRRTVASFRRLLLALRDGTGDPAEVGAAIQDIRPALKYRSVTRACQDIGRSEWIRRIWEGSTDAISALGLSRPRPDGDGPAQNDVVTARISTILPIREDAATGPLERDLTIATGPAHVRYFAKLTTEQVLQAHEALVREFKNSRDPVEPPGVKSMHLLESAVARQHTSFGGLDKYRTLPAVPHLYSTGSHSIIRSTTATSALLCSRSSGRWL